MLIDAMLTAPIARAAQAARTLDRLGVDGIWSAESNQDPFFPLAIAGENTTAPQLGTSVAIALARSPMTLAYEVAAVSAIAPGRVIVGLGSQLRSHIRRRFDMPWSEPVERMREYVLAFRAIWDAWTTGNRLAFRGKYFRHTFMPDFFVPDLNAATTPPVFVAGVGERMTRVAGAVAEGFIAHPLSSQQFLQSVTIPALQSGAAASARTVSDLVVAAVVPVVTGTDEEMAEGIDFVRAQIAFYASVATYRPVLAVHNMEDLYTDVGKAVLKGRRDRVSEVISDEVLNTFAVVAAPNDLSHALATRYASVVDRLILSLPASAYANIGDWHDRLAEIRLECSIASDPSPNRTPMTP